MLSRFRQRGLSMIELLVALAISSFLILGITQVYIDNKRNYMFPAKPDELRKQPFCRTDVMICSAKQAIAVRRIKRCLMLSFEFYSFNALRSISCRSCANKD